MMAGFSLVSVARTGLVIVAVVFLTVLSQNWASIPAPVFIGVLVPACLIGMMIVVYLERRKVSIRLARIDQIDERLEEYARVNAQLTAELLESRQLEEAQLLQVRALDAFLQGVVITDPQRPDNPIVFVNEGFTRLTGYTKQEVLGKNCRFMQGKETAPEAIQRLHEAIHDAKPCSVEIANYRKDGSMFWNALSVAPIVEDGLLTHFVGVMTDITNVKTLEQQLRQASKMEAIGHLAGGIAHDFNNLLTVINGWSEMLLLDPALNDHTRGLIGEIEKAGQRAATMTRQLLAFSRKAVLQPRVLSLNELVTDFQRLLVRLIGEDIQLVTKLHPQLHYVRVDQGQMEQALMNLVVNARDAMPKGGTLTIETIEEPTPSFIPDSVHELSTGRYVSLRVSDTGCGMSPDTLARVFEPFFTTKPVGQGTGLGLAMVYGFVKASGGLINVTSAVNEGTTFSVSLPIVSDTPRTIRTATDIMQPSGSETILVVEDEDGVRRFVSNVLQAHGYQVLEADTGREALRVLGTYRGSVHLLLTDVVMPQMSGRELSEQVRMISPETRVIFTSGYTNDAVLRYGVSQAETDFLQKPFTIEELLTRTREVLDRTFSSSETLVG